MQLFSVKDFAHRVRINIIFCSTSQHTKRQRLNGMSIRGAHVLQLLNYYFIYRMPFKQLTSYFFFRLNFTLSHLMDSQPNNKPNNCYGNHVDVDGGKKKPSMITFYWKIFERFGLNTLCFSLKKQKSVVRLFIQFSCSIHVLRA